MKYFARTPGVVLPFFIGAVACSPPPDEPSARVDAPERMSGGQTGASSGGGSSGPAGGGAGGTPSSPTDPGGTDVPDWELEERGWKLVWADEFEGEEIDPANWTHEVDCWGGGNNELQCYVDDEKNSFIESGHLHIIARADRPSGPVRGPGSNTEVVTRPYSSARLITRDKADFKYGRFEARIKLPFGQGLWPAFWMLPADDVYGGWAASGEIDIMEAINSSPSNNLVYGTLHYGGSWPGNTHTGDSYQPPEFIAETFYTYAVEWEEGAMHWFVDDVHYSSQSDWYTESAEFPAPFDQHFFLILNVAVGGNWPGSPDGSTTFPQEMVVDYVRAYECTKDPVTGHGCSN